MLKIEQKVQESDTIPPWRDLIVVQKPVTKKLSAIFQRNLI